MNKKILFLSLSLVGIFMIYTSCKKANSTTNTSTVSTMVVTQQLATNLSQALYGKVGGLNIGNGLSTPTGTALAYPGFKGATQSNTAFSFSHGRLVSVVNPNNAPSECGKSIDTTINYHSPAGDTSSASIYTHLKFSVGCTNSIPTSLNLFDTLNFSLTTPSFVKTGNYGYTLVITDSLPNDTTSKIQLKGALNAQVNFQSLVGSKIKTNGIFDYNFQGLFIDQNNGDIRTGSATFTTSGTDGKGGTWNYSGTITFLGNHQAKVLINGSLYNIDLLTDLVQ